MKKSTKLIVALLVVVAALAVTYRLMHRVPSSDLEANAQMQQIITDAGCLRCHTSTPDLPFYASMPVAGKIVMEDVSEAYRAFDMTQMEKDLKEGRPLNPVDLAKVEKVILDGKMPQAKYYLVHWGASFNDAKKEVALSWVKNHRMGLYTDVAVAPDFTNEPVRPIADSIAVDVRKVVLGDLLYHDMTNKSVEQWYCQTVLVKLNAFLYLLVVLKLKKLKQQVLTSLVKTNSLLKSTVDGLTLTLLLQHQI